MRTVHFILIFSLLSSTPPLQAEEDYDLYDTRGRRIGEMRSRGSRITVIDELTVDPNAPTVGEGWTPSRRRSNTRKRSARCALHRNSLKNNGKRFNVPEYNRRSKRAGMSTDLNLQAESRWSF